MPADPTVRTGPAFLPSGLAVQLLTPLLRVGLKRQSQVEDLPEVIKVVVKKKMVFCIR